MSLKLTPGISSSLAFRLAAWLAGVVGVCLLATFVIVYVIMAAGVRERLDRRLQHEAGEVATLFSVDGPDAIEEALLRMAQAEGTGLVHYRLLDHTGQVVAETDTASWPGLGIDQDGVSAAVGGVPFYETVPGSTIEDEARVIYAALSESLVLQVAVRTADDLAHLRDLRRLFLTVGAIGLLFSTILSWRVVSRALAPLHGVTRTAQAIARGDLSARVKPESRDAELRDLASAFNLMLNRIESFVRELTEMNDGLAHDLRTVLARIHLAADRLLSSRPLSEEQESLAVSISEESDRLLDMLSTVMDLSEMNTGVAKLRAAEVDLAALCSELCEFFELTASERGVVMNLDTALGAVVSGDASRLRRAIANLIDNALKYSAKGGRIDVNVDAKDEWVEVRVADTGSGIPAAAMPFIFDRFYRADQSRSSQGHGLGLSLTKAIIAMHGGKIAVDSREGFGSNFAISLPRSARAHQ